MDFNLILSKIILAVKDLDVQAFEEAYNIVLENFSDDLDFRNTEIISSMDNIYSKNLVDLNNDLYLNFIEEIVPMMHSFDTNYLLFRLVSNIRNHDFTLSHSKIKLLLEDVSSIEHQKEVLYLKLNVANHELNYSEIQRIINKLESL